MKKFLLGTIMVYKNIFSPLLHQLLGMKNACRYEIPCSAYAQQAIEKYGAGKGTLLSLRRMLNCQPFFSI